MGTLFKTIAGLRLKVALGLGKQNSSLIFLVPFGLTVLRKILVRPLPN
jgi:hypothetical protein